MEGEFGDEGGLCGISVKLSCWVPRLLLELGQVGVIWWHMVGFEVSICGRGFFLVTQSQFCN